MPLRYRTIAEPIQDCREEIAALLGFLEQTQGWDLHKARLIAQDGETFNQRWLDVRKTALPQWIEELRMLLQARGLPSTLPPADPSDPP